MIEWSRDERRASLACRYANRYPMVICGSLVLSLYSSCTCWIKLCMTLDSTWCNMYCTGDLLLLLIHGLASIFGSGRFNQPERCSDYLKYSKTPRQVLDACRTRLRRARGLVRPGATGLLTGVEYSRVRDSSWMYLISIVTTQIGVELAAVQR